MHEEDTQMLVETMKGMNKVPCRRVTGWLGRKDTAEEVMFE